MTYESANDRTCFYCSKLYESVAILIEHLRDKHKGTYAYYSIAGGDQDE